MDGGAWRAAVHGVAEGRTRLSDFTFTFHCHALEKEMATHSSVLAWRIPGTGEPGGLLSLGSHRVGDDWSDLAAWPIILLKCITNWSVFCSLQPNFDWYNLLNLFLGPSIFHWFSKYLLNAFSETSVETYFSDVSNNSFRSHKLYVVLKIIFPAK